jgi:hypothetical protein
LQREGGRRIAGADDHELVAVEHEALRAVARVRAEAAVPERLPVNGS